ncbi:PTS lactose/cellobiose transporter subunit IIA [Oceanivirga salmonicida]|uniref:PTS lactose/cellobiose transporter subunit IIA n=1 Tax=Oceanivirga salmonicida TaxID=1769291 RepID=UPI0008307315|nr:PTS lactose/cellobiose transporter subunit IIA [Oceanivirga salmonicida]
MNYEELSEYAMEIIANSGMSRSCSMEAINFAKKGEFKKAEESMREAEKYYFEAHEGQTNLIVKETSGEEKINLNLLMVHAQDHLSMALITKDNAKEFIELYKRIGGENG